MNNTSKGTIIRTALLLLALTNQILSIFGISPIPIEDEQLTLLISTLWTVGSSLWAFWKNNSFTRAAMEGDREMRRIRAHGK